MACFHVITVTCVYLACQKEKKGKKKEKRNKAMKGKPTVVETVMMMNNKRARMGHFVSMITGPTRIHLPHTGFR